MDELCKSCYYFKNVRDDGYGSCINAKQAFALMGEDETCSNWEPFISEPKEKEDETIKFKDGCEICKDRLSDAGLCNSGCSKYPPVDVKVEPKGEILMDKVCKKYPIPSEIVDIISEHMAYDNLKEIYARIPFGFNKAVRCGKKSRKLHRRFWNSVYKLYEELEGKKLNMKVEEEYVYVYIEEVTK